MRTTTRRRIDGALLIAGASALGAGSALAGLAADNERVTGMWVGATLTEDGAAPIVETIDYDFGLAAEKHGIFRTVPGLEIDAPVRVASTSAPDGIADKTSEHIGSGLSRELGVRLKIGDPNTTITGRHRYTIEYELSTLQDPSGLAWDAVGTGWEIPVMQSEVHVVAPWRFERLSCDTGRAGATGGCEVSQLEPGHLVATVGSLDPGEGLTIRAARGERLAVAPTLPAPPIDAPPDPGAGLAKPAGLAAVVAVGAAGLSSRWVRRRGRERVGTGGVADAAWAGDGGPTSEVLLDQAELGSMATTEFAPPEGVSPAQGGVILTETVSSEHKVAWLIDAAIAGAVELVEEDGKTVRLVRGPGGPAETSAILDVAFDGRTEIDLKTYDAKFAKAWTSVGTSLDAWRGASGLWDPAGDRRRAIIRALGVGVAIVGAGATLAGAAMASRWGAEWMPLIVLGALAAGAGFAAAIRGWELRVRTPAGSGLWLRIESFRRFLAGSEAFHAEEAAKRGVLREYTAWAVAVGEIDRWGRAVAAASTAIPKDSGLGYVYLAPLLIASTSSASTAPSSSGGGGGGGGVGGGGGGGGGGSW